MSTLPTHLVLPEVAKLSARVVRVMGLNPSAMTLGGTNTYIVGQGTQRALVDTGEGVEQYSEVLGHALADAAKELGSKVVISRVLLTHWHHDHIGGVAQVRQMFPEAQVLKAPSRLLPTDSALNREALLLADGERISIDDGCTLRVVATPGHTDDHLSFVLEEEEAIFYFYFCFLEFLVSSFPFPSLFLFLPLSLKKE